MIWLNIVMILLTVLMFIVNNTYLASVKANDTKKLIPLLELLMIMPKKLIK